jgi:flagellar basal-body rod modification protein FlgD
MATDSIAPVSFVPGTLVPQDRVPVKTLNQQDFLKLLVAQMTQQDPLNAKTDLEMIPQMVSFTQLEQSKSMQADIASLRADQRLLQANALLGRTVEIQDGTTPGVTGQVTAVQMEEGTPKLVVNGHRYDLGDLLSITPAAVP